MILLTGRHVLRRLDNPNIPVLLEWASISAANPSYLKAWIDDELIEHVEVGPSASHTWWSSNPLFSERQTPPPGGLLIIEVGPGAIFRIESNLEVVTV